MATWTLKSARLEAQDLTRQISKGADPLEAKRRRKGEPTVSELAAEWLDAPAAGLRSESADRRMIGGDLVNAIDALKVTDARRLDFIEIMEAKALTAPR